MDNNVYMAYKTEITWRALLEKSLTSWQEVKVSKTSKQVPGLVCALCSFIEKHILPLLLIGKASKPYYFKNVV